MIFTFGKTTYIYTYFNGVTCVLFVCVQNCVRVACAGTERQMLRYKNEDTEKPKYVPE